MSAYGLDPLHHPQPECTALRTDSSYSTYCTIRKTEERTPAAALDPINNAQALPSEILDSIRSRWVSFIHQLNFRQTMKQYYYYPVDWHGTVRNRLLQPNFFSKQISKSKSFFICRLFGLPLNRPPPTQILATTDNKELKNRHRGHHRQPLRYRPCHVLCE